MDEKDIGGNIRRFRQEKGLTLEQTAQKAGLTKGALSKIETGQISPPISTVLRIADALGVALAEFFSEPVQNPNFVVTRKGKGNKLVRDGSQFGYSYEALALSMPGKKAEPFILTMKPTDPQGTFQHGGDEFIYMLEGKMELTIGDDPVVLNPGDSIYFNPRLVHKSRTLGKTACKYLSVFVQDAPEEKAKPSGKK